MRCVYVQIRPSIEETKTKPSVLFPICHFLSQTMLMEIAHFLKRNNDQVIFSTYQSSPLIAQAQKNNEVPRF